MSFIAARGSATVGARSDRALPRAAITENQGRQSKRVLSCADHRSPLQKRVLGVGGDEDVVGYFDQVVRLGGLFVAVAELSVADDRAKFDTRATVSDF